MENNGLDNSQIAQSSNDNDDDNDDDDLKQELYPNKNVAWSNTLSQEIKHLQPNMVKLIVVFD